MEDRIEEVVSRLNSHQRDDTEDERLDRLSPIDVTSCELDAIYSKSVVERVDIAYTLMAISSKSVAVVLALLNS